MAEEKTTQLSEEEKIEQKLRMRRILSNIFIVVACISIIVFVVLMFMTKKNVSTQTQFDTQEMRGKLMQIISLERNFYEQKGVLVDIKYLALARDLPQYNPSIDGFFKYQFDAKTGIATGIEKDSSNDVNGDEDGNDGLTLSINWEPGKTDGSDFFWTDDEIAVFQQRQQSGTKIVIGETPAK
jgi:hypothetical protein